MLTIAGGIILAVVIMGVIGALVVGMFSGFAKNPPLGCPTMVVFGLILMVFLALVFG